MKDTPPTTRLAVLITRIFGDELGSRVLGPGMIALVIKIMSAAASYIMLVAFARMLSPVEYGHFGLMMNLAIVFSSIIGAGFVTGVMRFWPEHIAKSQPRRAVGFLRASVYVMAGAAAIALLIAIVLAQFGRTITIFGSAFGPIVVVILAAAIGYGDLLSNALRVFGSTVWSLLPRDVLFRILAPIAAAGYLWTTGHINALVACLAIVAVFGPMVILQLIRTRNLAHIAVGHHKPEFAWATWRSSLMALSGAALLLSMVQQMDVVIVGSIVGAEQAGAYFAAQKTAALLSLVMIAGGIVAAPMMASAFHSGKYTELQKLCRTLSIAIAFSTLLGFLFMAIAGPFLLSIFDASYVTSYSVLMVLSLGMMLDALAGPSAYLMQMTSLEKPYLRIMAIVYAMVLSAQLVFVPRYGVMAAAILNAMGVLVWNFLAIQLLRKNLGIDPSVFALIWPVKPAGK